MSGVRPPHLQRRAGTYRLRVRVPDDVRMRVGSPEVRRSLRVHTLTKARPLALKYAARVMEVFDMARTRTLTEERTWRPKGRSSPICAVNISSPETGSRCPETAGVNYLSLVTEQNVSPPCGPHHIP